MEFFLIQGLTPKVTLSEATITQRLDPFSKYVRLIRNIFGGVGMKKAALAFLFFFAVLPLFADQEVGDESWGFKFKVPAGWVYQQDTDGVILGHNTIPGMIIVMPHMQASLQAVTSEMQAGIMEEGIQLFPAGGLEGGKNNVIAGNYQGAFNGQSVRARVIGTFSPYGGGAYIFALALPNEFGSPLTGAADTIARGMQYIKIDLPSLMAHFAGAWVSFTSNTESYMTLMGNGEYTDSYVSSYSGDFSDSFSGEQTGSWGVAGEDQDRGRWTVRGNKNKGTIFLTAAEGNKYEMYYEVHVEKGQVYWNEYYFNGKLYIKQR
jgi:hypothetical protein